MCEFHCDFADLFLFVWLAFALQPGRAGKGDVPVVQKVVFLTTDLCSFGIVGFLSMRQYRACIVFSSCGLMGRPLYQIVSPCPTHYLMRHIRCTPLCRLGAFADIAPELLLLPTDSRVAPLVRLPPLVGPFTDLCLGGISAYTPLMCAIAVGTVLGRMLLRLPDSARRVACTMPLQTVRRVCAASKKCSMHVL